MHFFCFVKQEVNVGLGIQLPFSVFELIYFSSIVSSEGHCKNGNELLNLQTTGVDAWASVKSPARFVSYLFDIYIYELFIG